MCVKTYEEVKGEELRGRRGELRRVVRRKKQESGDEAGVKSDSEVECVREPFEIAVEKCRFKLRQ